MSITQSSEPSKWCSVYRPIEFVFGSDRYPNTVTGEVNVPVLFIQRSDLGVFVTISTPFTTFDLSAGELLNITGTDGGLYEGNYRVTNAFISSGVLVAYIDAEYVGDDTGGTASRIYENFRLAGTVNFTGSGRAVPFELSPDENGLFTLNVQGMASRQFKRIFEVVEPGLAFGVLRSGDTSIAQSYKVQIWERFTLWENGVPRTFDDKKDTVINLRPFIAVNCVHPDHKSEPFTFDWQQPMDAVFPMGNGTGQRRALTWASRTKQEVSSGEDFFISFLINSQTEIRWQLVVTSYYNGTPFVAQAQVIDAFPNYAATINVGPSVLTALSGADEYGVRILDLNGNDILEEFRIKYVPKCAEVNKRIYAHNKAGGIDQFTMRGREMTTPTAARDSIKRTYNPVLGRGQTSLGGWMERGYRVDPERAKVLTSDFLNVDTLKWLSEEVFESADIVTEERDGWWTPMVVDGTEGTSYGTNNGTGRFVLAYHLGVDNLSQRG